ncbi:MAG: DUF1415 domain-containing protein [Pseudomonadota bacterium]
MTTDKETVIRNTTRWLGNVVVGLGLCPFAKPVIDEGKLEVVVTDANDSDALLATLDDALSALTDTGPDTTLIVVPNMLQSFDDYLDFLDIADALLEARRKNGVIQIASFHPDYQFDGTDQNDVSNYTNRSPYPMLHLLREADVQQAVDGYPDVEGIPNRNIETLNALSLDELQRLFAR